MILGSLMLKAFLLGVLGSLDRGGQTRACEVPRIHDKKGNEKKIIEVTSGEEAKLLCGIRTSDQIPKPEYKWLKDNQTLTPSSHPRMRLKPLRYLKIKEANKEDAGFYTCVAVNDCGKNSYTMQLFVRIAPIFTVKPEKMRRNFHAVPVGNTAKLDCSADGNPPPTVKWYKDGKLFKERKGSQLHLSQWATVLSLKDLVATDSGSYMCNVSNSYGWINHTYKVDVHERARAKPVLLPMENVTVHRGENASLTCKALSDSMPHFQWLRWFPMRSNGSVNSSANGSIESPHYEIVNKDDTDQRVITSTPTGKKFEFHGVKLTLVNVTKRDRGKYTCIVGNAIGYAVEHAYISVRDWPAPPSSPKVSYNVSTLPPETEHVTYLTGYDKKAHDAALVPGTVSACVLTIAVAVVIISCWRRRSRNRRHLSSRILIMSELEFEYDAFVIFSSQDLDWVNKTLIPTLEKKHGFKCCVHYRDFVLGIPYRENMVNSVYKSRKTVAVVSKNFFKSNYCGSEMEYALHRLMEKRDDSVVVIKLDDVDNANLPKELRKRSYLDYPNNAEKNHWERKLVNCLTISYP